MQTVAEGQQLELPLWMAERLREARYISVSLPRNFSAKVRESLLAAPQSVRLRERSPHFYEVGLRLAALADTDEAKTLPASIQATLATRVSMILTRALHSEGIDTSRFTEGLTDLEQSLFWAGYRHAKDVREWRLGHTSLMKASGAYLCILTADAGSQPELAECTALRCCTAHAFLDFLATILHCS